MTASATTIYQTIRHVIVRNRRAFTSLIYLAQAAFANYMAFVLRFEWTIPPAFLPEFFFFLPVLLIIRVVFYLQAGLYKDLWRYSSIGDLLKLIKSVTFSSIVFAILVRYVFGDTTYPRSIYVLDWVFLIMIAGGSRLMLRIFKEYLQSEPTGKATLLIGAGDAGEMIVRDMKNNPKYSYRPIGFIDDNLNKKGYSIHGIPIFGPRSLLLEVIEKHKPQEIIITMPSMGHKVIKEIYDLCKPFKIPIKTLPGIADILDGKVSISQIKPISLEDLLQRDPVRTDIESVRSYISGKSVLVTGAGGSIGSELCRQIAEYGPSRLLILDRYENGLFEIDMELRRKKTSLNIDTVVGDICDRGWLDHFFSQVPINIVFHAAAHKHVPLMEHNPLQAVKNNVFGTQNLVEISARHNVESFIMISTDKAVNPSSIMGATKRIAEFFVLNMNSISSTKFTTVRFGNVLGSNGSVVHIFKDQIKRGVPLTVTHPDIARFFMLIPEAVQLVLIAASTGSGGEIFVLDMGEQIKIVDFAENLIRLSGFVPYEDIQIEFSGLRPGEKLFEELFDESEKMLPTSHDKLMSAIPLKSPSMEELVNHISNLYSIVSKNEADKLLAEIRKIVPNFRRS